MDGQFHELSNGFIAPDNRVRQWATIFLHTPGLVGENRAGIMDWSGSGHIIDIRLWNPGEEVILSPTPETYEFYDPPPFPDNRGNFRMWIPLESGGQWANMIGGSISIGKSGDIYGIDFNIDLDNGTNVTGTYEGSLVLLVDW